MSTAKSTILYIDDDSDDCLFLKNSLEISGNRADLVCAPDGEEAITYLNSLGPETFPSLIVLDLNMPRWDGKKTLSYLKSQPQFAGIPVAVLSTSSNVKERQLCVDLGAVSYHQKPHHFDGYRGIVESFYSFMKY